MYFNYNKLKFMKRNRGNDITFDVKYPRWESKNKKASGKWHEIL